jgi:enoyl-CoA hydratase/carnithine racemase
MQTVTYEAILVEVDDEVGIVTLNRPDKMNAYTTRMGLELSHALYAFDQDDDVRAVVVTGAGPAFCAGADLEKGGDTFGPRALEDRKELAGLFAVPPVAPWEMATPIIAAINGAAVGVGLTLPMQWDIRIAADDAKLGFVFNRRGVIPELNMHWLLPRLVGVSNGLELLLTGRIFTGAEAAQLGVVSRAVPRGAVKETAFELAHDIAHNVAPVSAAITKKLVYQLLETTDRAAAGKLVAKLFAWAGRQPDSAEGIMAFLEKRPPNWSMSKTEDLPEELR